MGIEAIAQEMMAGRFGKLVGRDDVGESSLSFSIGPFEDRRDRLGK